MPAHDDAPDYSKLQQRTANTVAVRTAKPGSNEDQSPDGPSDIDTHLSLERLKIDLTAHRDYHEMRREWSRFLKGALIAILISEAALVIFVVYFTRKSLNQGFLDLAFSQAFLQIVGMCFIVVKFLFPSQNHLPNSTSEWPEKKRSRPAKNPEKPKKPTPGQE